MRSIVIDVQCIGGPLRFLEAGRLLHALGATIGGHRIPYYSSHLLTTLPRSLPLETIDWANPALEPYHAPDKKHAGARARLCDTNEADLVRPLRAARAVEGSGLGFHDDFPRGRPAASKMRNNE